MADESSLMLFSVREFIYALEIGTLLEVAQVPAERVYSEEEGPFRYKLDFRGTRIPLLDLAERSGMPPFPMTGTLQLLVVEADHRPFALLITRILEVAKGKGTVYRFPSMFRTGHNRYIEAVYRLDNKMSFVLNPKGILRDNEIAAMRSA
ncbi:MAG: chemotaxis protein CheW [Deltaproteobacteria bacterium]|nr:chemotaxis protein CheW [Deltaproteobacteria bacterium]